MNIKAILKRFIPSLILVAFRKKKNRRFCKKIYMYDADRFMNYSNTFHKWDNCEKLIGQIIAEYHVIEKGLAMPNMRLGFGEKILTDLINHCRLYSFKYDTNNEQFLYALRVLNEYKLEHDKQNYELNKFIKKDITNLTKTVKAIIPSEQISTTREEYLKHIYGSFQEFSNSRHSLRNFTGEINIDDIKKAVCLAQNAPSACNRQPSRVNILENKKIIEQVLNIQSGNRGFGNLADKLIILTAELGGFLSLNERNDVYVNGGIYAMNLLYSLHYYKIGTCTLNWCSSPEQDLKLRTICNIPNSETVILMIVCGGIPDKFKLVTSYRNDYNKILRII